MERKLLQSVSLHKHQILKRPQQELSEFLHPEDFQGHIPDELGTVNQVSSPEAPRLREEAKKPFEAVLPHPARRLFQTSRVEIECRTHTYHHRYCESVSMFVHPILLLGRAQPYPEHVRSGSLYQSHRFSVLSWGQLPERRRVSPRYSDAMLAVKHFGKVFGNTWCAAVLRQNASINSGP